MQILEEQPLKDLSSMKIGGSAKYFATISSTDDVSLLHEYAESKSLPLVVIGSGTNTIFKEGLLNKVIGLMDIKGIRVIKNFEHSCQVEAMAGESWDDFVKWAVNNNLSGIEALSGIPGTVGAAPVQNIGAYGSEFSDTFVNVTAYDTENKELVLLGLNDCKFGYRNSIFKENLGRFIITSVTLELSKKKPEVPKYKDIQLYFLGRKTTPNLKAIRKAIINIRTEKLPNIKVNPNSGSFFKNPVLPNEEVVEILKKHPNMPHFKVDEQNIKLYAGWLIESIKFKENEFGNLSLHKDSALVLINNGKASFKELESTRKKITNKVKEKFGITLEIEPQIIS